MGSPLSPVFANIYLAHHEATWLKECPPDIKLALYQRYVDDTFVLFKTESDVGRFLNYLNQKHPNMKFTGEVEKDNRLPFLGTTVFRNGNAFETTVYRKETFTGLYAHFKSFAPIKYKVGLILILLNRAFSICTRYVSFDEEVRFIKKLLQRNGFGLDLINRTIETFLNRKYEIVEKVSSVPKQKVTVLLPFTGCHGFQIRKRLVQLCLSAYPHIDLNVVFQVKQRIGHFFHFKDRVPWGLQSNVIYSYRCQRCTSLYVGKTSRQLHIRSCEHRGISFRTGKYLGHPPFSAIRNHCNETNHDFDVTRFKVLSKAQNTWDLNIKESIYVWDLKLNLNIQTDSVSLILF